MRNSLYSFFFNLLKKPTCFHFSNIIWSHFNETNTPILYLNYLILNSFLILLQIVKTQRSFGYTSEFFLMIFLTCKLFKKYVRVGSRTGIRKLRIQFISNTIKNTHISFESRVILKIEYPSQFNPKRKFEWVNQSIPFVWHKCAINKQEISLNIQICILRIIYFIE